MKKILLPLTLSASLFAQYNFLLGDELDNIGHKRVISTKPLATPSKAYYSFLPYAGVINYSKETTKDEGFVTGIYFSDFESPFKTEIDVEQSSITYKDETPDLSQGDFTFLVNYYQGYNLAYKFGLHYIDSTDTQTDGGIIFIGGILYYKTLLYNYGLDVYYSDYSNTSTSPKILQFTPKFGFNFGDYYSLFGSFYLEAKVDYIQNKDEDESYISNSFKLSNYNGAFTTTVSFWNGERVYGVENSGFVVNNLNEKQTGGFKVSESYKLDRISFIKFTYSKTKFEDIGEAESKVYLLTYGYSF